MEKIESTKKIDPSYFVGIAFLIILSLSILIPVAPTLFPTYLLYVILALVGFFVFASIDFEIISIFSTHLYIGSIIFLILPLLIGQVTRGAIRWIPIGPLTIQPAEIVRPFLLVFFANFLASQNLDLKRLIQSILLFTPPFFLIAFQPSLGVALLTAFGFFGVLLSSTIKKKYFLFGAIILLVATPLFWQLLAPYQKTRIISFVDPSRDPRGSGYHSIQSMIAVGSGKLFGRGLGKGVQTQLAFLPEKHTDFIFAAISEEMGLVGSLLVTGGLFFLLIKLTKFIENAISPPARAFLSGLFLALFVQVIIHIGMNMGLLPITGVPLPLVSAGGSSLFATMIALGMALGARKR